MKNKIMTDYSIRCKECGEILDHYEAVYGKGLCYSCSDKKKDKEESIKKRRKIIIFSLITIILVLIAVPLSIVQWNYDLEKCDNLKSSESSYDFTNRVEVNAKYNDNCYYLHNYPLAFAGYIIVAVIIPVIMIGGIYLIHGLLSEMLGDYY